VRALITPRAGCPIWRRASCQGAVIIKVPSSACPGPLILRWRDAPTPRTKSSAKLRLIVTALAMVGLAWCPRQRQPRALCWSKRRAGRSFRLGAAKEGAPGLSSRAVFNKRPSYGRFVLRSDAPPGLVPSGVLLEPPPAQRPPPRPTGRRHCARSFPPTTSALAPAPAAAPGLSRWAETRSRRPRPPFMGSPALTATSAPPALPRRSPASPCWQSGQLASGAHRWRRRGLFSTHPPRTAEAWRARRRRRGNL
jgi:hypothetical protein